MDSSGTAMGMKQVQDPQPLLKCPRCDSSNTKFCYFNNYSLSQPRHFCKACKRYWTRGGTLRSVPVGGGCRKNKRMKRSKTALDPTPGIPIIKSSNHNTNALTSSSVFYTQEPNNQSHNYPLQSFNSRIMNQISSCIGYDTGVSQAGFSPRNDLAAQQIHDVGDSHASLVNFQGFGSSNLLQQQRYSFKEVKLPSDYEPMFPFKSQVLDPCSITDQVTVTKEVKREEESELLSNKVDSDASCIDSMVGFDSLAFWNTVGAWPEISNYESPVVSLI